MKTFDEILERMCQESYGMSFIECCDKIVYHGLKTIARHAAKEYANQCIKEHLSRAAENAKTKQHGRYEWVRIVDRESITNIEIKLP